MSAERRRAERRARLLDAGLDVVGETGVAGLTMTAVCARARLTERYFYENFRNRDQLLVAIFDQLADQWIEAVTAAIDVPGDLFARARAGLAVLVDGVTEDHRKARLFGEATGHDALRQRRAERLGEFADLLAEVVRHEYQLHGYQQQQRLDLVGRVIVSGMAEAGVSWLAGEITLSRDEFLDESARLCVAAAETIRDT